MTVPSRLLQEVGPAQWDWLIHFCGRPPERKMTPFVPDAIRKQAPWQRLDNILWEQRLNGYPPFGAGADQSMICLSESTEEHLCWLLNDRHWPPWGLVFTRQEVYELGGGPVWYARQEQYDILNEDQYRWAVRFNTSNPRSDWLHEREWRIPAPPGYQALDLGTVTVKAILIDDPDWQPSLRTEDLTRSGNPYGQPQVQHVPALPPLWQDTHRFYWNRTANDLRPCGP